MNVNTLSISHSCLTSTLHARSSSLSSSPFTRSSHSSPVFQRLLDTSMASASTSSPTIPASSSQSWKYDVFLSYRGEDTRKTFVDHIYAELVRRLIHTYKDDQTLPRGDSIGPSLMRAIEESQIAIIIFSKNYADSSWCLDELTHIMKCRDERGQVVMPIYYDMDPSEVRNQKPKFGDAFGEHKKKKHHKVESWRKALRDAGGISGWELKNIADGHESQGIKQIVDTILDKLFSLKSSYVNKNLVGMGTRSQFLKSQLNIGSRGVRMIGIWGVGGGGKTTLASCVYTEISHHFGGHYFVENIRKESSKHDLKYLQGKFLKTVLSTQVEVQSVEEGKYMIKQRLCYSNVLIVLDDVDHIEQLEALAGNHDWFGDGSRIIITTRDEHLLRTHKVNEVYPVNLLSQDEATELFHRHAYRENKPVEDYENLSLRVVRYAAGLPLALKVLGQFLCDKDKDEWISTLERLKDIPEKEIVEKLKISFDGLKHEEKEIFLDIACFFRGEYVQYHAMEMLEACHSHPIIALRVLIQKALITISDGVFDMHDQVQEMGRYIVQEEHPDNPEEHSRLWQTKVIDDLCWNDASTVNYKVKAIRYEGDSLHFQELVSNMKKLRFLYVHGFSTSHPQGPNFLSNELRCIYWRAYPAVSLPENFRPRKLAVLRLPGSLHKELWKGYKWLPRLKKLELNDLSNLLSTPDFDGLPCLEELSIKHCYSLEEIHPSLGNRESLKKISVEACAKLRMFPTIIKMEKLETFRIYSCVLLRKFPEIQSHMDRLVELYLWFVGIESLPSSIGERCTRLISIEVACCNDLKRIDGNFQALKHLKKLDFCDLPQLKKLPEFSLVDENCCLEKLRSSITGWCFFGLHHLRHCLRKLHLNGCRLKDGEISSDIGDLSNLQELDLSYNDFSRLHFSLLKLTHLKQLILSYCENLVELPDLPSSIVTLIAGYCSSLSSVGDGHTNCKWLSHVSFEGGHVVIDANRLLKSMLQGNAIENHCMSLQVPGVEIPKMFTPLFCGDRCTVQLPENWCNDFSGFLMCAVLTDNCSGPVDITIEHGIGRTGDQKDYIDDTSDVFTWVGYVSFASLGQTSWWDSTSNTISFSVHLLWRWMRGSRCTGFGVKLIRGSTMETSQVTTDNSEYDYEYVENFGILDDSKSALRIHLNTGVAYYNGRELWI